MWRFGFFASGANFYFSVVRPGAPPLLSGWAGSWGTIPTLSVGGWNISLAGLVLPLSITVLLLRGFRVADLPRSAAATLLATLVFNALFVSLQAQHGFPGGGVHLLTFAPALLLLDALRVAWRKSTPKYIDKPRMLRMLTGLSFVSILPVDALGGVLMARQQGVDPLAGLQWVGGAGWHDGLLLSVLLMSAGGSVVWLTHRLTSCAPPASSPA
jgi:hypothetical protein